MIPIQRLPLPAEVVVKMTALTGRIEDGPPAEQIKNAQKLWGQRNVRTGVVAPVRTVLQRMAPGIERCMYCGDSFGTDVDHHEPIARAPLRAFDWLNHLLACSHCNSGRKGDAFPVDDRGSPLLIDPTAEDPFDHLLLSLSTGEYAPLTEKGHHTIEVLGLNRFGLARGRQHSFRVVVLCLRAWGRDRRAELLTMIREQPGADVCQAMLRQARLPGAAIVFAAVPDVVGLLRDERIRAALLRQPVTPGR